MRKRKPCSFKLSESRKDKFTPRCNVFRSGYCDRMNQGVPFCPYKKKLYGKYPPIIRVEVTSCEYMKQAPFKKNIPRCIFNLSYVCELVRKRKKPPICPWLKTEMSLNAVRDAKIEEIYGEVDAWVEHGIPRKKKKS